MFRTVSLLSLSARFGRLSKTAGSLNVSTMHARTPPHTHTLFFLVRTQGELGAARTYARRKLDTTMMAVTTPARTAKMTRPRSV